MAFTLSGTTITQTAGTTDTSWDGINGMAGVTRVSMGEGFLYYCPTLLIRINGTVTIADPSKSTVIPYAIQIGGTGNYTSGSFAADGVTPKSSGIHFQAFGFNNQMSDTVAGAAFGVDPSGRATLIGGSYYVNGSITYANGAIIREYGVDKYATRGYGAGSVRVRAFATDVILRNTRHYDIAYDLFRMPTEFSAKAFGSEYLMQYVGAVAGGTDAKFVAYAPSNVDGTYDFDNYGAGWVELYNSAKGAALNVVIQNPTAGYRNAHVVPLFQEVNFKVTNLAGANIQNARFKSTDAPVNSPTATITTASSLKTWDFRTPLSYTGTTNASGVAASVPILQVWWGTANTKNLRFPSSTANYQFRTYDYQTQDTSIVLGSDTAIAKGMALVPLATAVTVNEATAAALTGIAFTASGATGGSIVISANRTLQDLWNYYRYWISQFTNWASTDTWTCNNGVLNMGAWSLTVDSGSALTKTTAISSLTTTTSITINGTTDATYTDSTGTRVALTNRNGVIMTSYVLINGTPVGGATVGGTFVPGFVPLVMSRTLTVLPADTIRMVVNSYGYKPQVINCTGADLDAFTVTLEIESGVDVSSVSTITRDAVAATLGFIQASPTQIDITVNQTLVAYFPKDCVAGVAYAFVTKGYLAFAAMAQANNANIYSLSNGQMVTYFPGFKLRMNDTDSGSAAIVPTATGYSIPLVAYYFDQATSTAYPVTILNASNAKIETAPWTQATATLSEQDKNSIAAKVDASTVLAKEATVATRASQASVTALGTPLQASSYTAPDNAGITAIKAKTDTLVNGPTLVQIEGSTILAKESTLAGKASQASVTALGTPMQAGEVVDANLVKVNDIFVDGTGTKADPWGPV
jgi:hypothetical protein